MLTDKKGECPCHKNMNIRFSETPNLIYVYSLQLYKNGQHQINVISSFRSKAKMT